MPIRRATEEEFQEVEEAFHLVHDNLQWMPENYCCWKKRSGDGRIIPKSLSGDYRPLYSFVRNFILRNNIAELRFCFDYHHSLYKLHNPGLTFGWQHKLVLCQIIAGIYEGLLLDLFEELGKQDGHPLLKTLSKQKLDNKGFGLGALLDIFSKSGLLDNLWYNYLDNMNHLRNTVHPKSLNHPHASYQNNPIIRASIEDLINKLDEFIKYVRRLYP